MSNPWISLGIVAFVLLAGCASERPAPTSPPGTDSGTGTQGTSGSVTGSASTTTAGTPGPSGGPGNRPPVARLELSIAAGPAPLATNITATVHDPDGDTVTGTLSFGDGTDDQALPGFPANVTHTFAAAGNYTIVLSVSDGKAGANATAAVTVSAGADSLHVEDPPGDAQSEYTDILAVDPAKTTTLDVVLQVDTVWPVAVGYSPVGYGITVNGGDFRCYAYQTGVLLWDATAAAYLDSADGSCAWDATANTVTFSLSVAYLAETDSFSAPFQLHASSFEGGIVQNLNDLTDDLAPDTGDIVVP